MLYQEFKTFSCFVLECFILDKAFLLGLYFNYHFIVLSLLNSSTFLVHKVVLGPAYSERQQQWCGAALIKLIRFLNKLSYSIQKWGATPTDGSFGADALNSSFVIFLFWFWILLDQIKWTNSASCQCIVDLSMHGCKMLMYTLHNTNDFMDQ